MCVVVLAADTAFSPEHSSRMWAAVRPKPYLIAIAEALLAIAQIALEGQYVVCADAPVTGYLLVPTATVLVGGLVTKRRKESVPISSSDCHG